MIQIIRTKTVTSLATRFLKRHGHWPRDPHEIDRAQSLALAKLLASLGSTTVGRRLGLMRSLTIAPQDLGRWYRQEIPVQRYADIEDLVQRVSKGERDVMFPGRASALAQTSGTTSANGSGERYIPQNSALLRQHTLGGKAALGRLLSDCGPSLLQGRLLMLGGSTALAKNAHGVPAGDLSGITVHRIPWLLQKLYEPGPRLSLEADWNRKVAGIAEKLSSQDVRLLAGIPSWCQVLSQSVRDRSGSASLAQAWPNLQGFLHGGVSASPYIPWMRQELSESCRMLEVYPASEGFLAIGSRTWSAHQEDAPPDLELLTNHGIYFEFLRGEDSGEVVDAAHLVPGEIYRILISTPGGLLRYELGDLVEGRGPGLIRFAGRIRTRLSLFGEHVEASAMAQALGDTCTATGSAVRHWHVAPLTQSHPVGKGRHEWWVEFLVPPKDPDVFALRLDDRLQELVLDYAAHRTGDAQLLAPHVRSVRPGGFDQILASKGKLGGQHKVPTAWEDRTWAHALESQRA